jgi:uncharacterized iron-regulated membrane protein
VISRLIRKIHIYAGLLTLAQLLLYGVAGLVATFQASQERPKEPHSVRYVPYAVPASAIDKQVADSVFQQLNPPLSRPVPDWFLQRTADNHLLLDFYNINGIFRVVVLEDESRLRIEQIRNSSWLFLNDMHALTLGDAQASSLVKIWAAWNELGMWSLLGFCVSGTYLWLTSRPRYLWAWVALTCGAIFFAALWQVFR